jgi:hypothetical protein
LFTFNNRNNFYIHLDHNSQLCKNVALYVHTGMLLFFGNYDEGLTESQQSLNTLPDADNPTRPT